MYSLSTILHCLLRIVIMSGEQCVYFTIFILFVSASKDLSEQGGKKSQDTVHSFIFSFLDIRAEKLTSEFGLRPTWIQICASPFTLYKTLGTPLSPSILDFLIYLVEIRTSSQRVVLKIRRIIYIRLSSTRPSTKWPSSMVDLVFEIFVIIWLNFHWFLWDGKG